ncbi:hypothetical protein U1P98_07475 [Lysinibacillus irui]|uniref:Uncharacterized protein n=1 Tax=Lysinibacillus irui TaxID=2998077 RepID=A0ABU5NJD4_9BACI|nr:hypothetical protein [Lysinibacillus irui]MEA0553755.1 hypothetical protein [Lysinibacillus irui]MEA0976139.1 hypothetical protein [Lysinibacillus irui]MEA1042293.1 hypothetical protein [Lysinibacillus irui]
MAYTKIKTTWLPDDPVLPEHIQHMETQYEAVKADLETGGTNPVIDLKSTVTVSDTITTPQTVTFTSPIRQMFGWLFSMIKKIKGTTNWFDNVPATLQDAANHFTSANPHEGVLEPYNPNIVKTNVEATMTAKLIANNDSVYGTRQVRNIIVSNQAPTAEDGQDGDIWLIIQ